MPNIESLLFEPPNKTETGGDIINEVGIKTESVIDFDMQAFLWTKYFKNKYKIAQPHLD